MFQHELLLKIVLKRDFDKAGKSRRFAATSRKASPTFWNFFLGENKKRPRFSPRPLRISALAQRWLPWFAFSVAFVLLLRPPRFSLPAPLPFSPPWFLSAFAGRSFSSGPPFPFPFPGRRAFNCCCCWSG